MTKNLAGGRGWLNDAAADSINRIDMELGRLLRINDAGRTRAEQQALWNRWQAGGAANRPPYLYLPAQPGTSPHESGNAIDTSEIDLMKRIGPKHGWIQNIPSDPVHFVFTGGSGTIGGGSNEAVVGKLNNIGAPAVKQMQTQLRVAVDGDAGPETITALQRRLGVTADGIWGPATLTALQAYSGATPDGVWGPQTHNSILATLNIGAFSPDYGKPTTPVDADVLEAQKLLNKANNAGLVEDGIRGPLYISAVNAFQSKYGLVVDGIFGPASKAKALAVIAGGGTTPPVEPVKKSEDEEATWIGSPNFDEQTGVTKEYLVYHWMAGFLSGTDAIFQRESADVATHYGVGPNASHQYVLEKDFAYANGNKDANKKGVSIEHEGGYLLADGVSRMTPVKEVLDRSARLSARLAKRHKLGKLVWMVNVFPHKHFVATACPGPVSNDPTGARLNHEYIIAEANRINGYDVVVPPIDPPVTEIPAEVIAAYASVNKATIELGALVDKLGDALEKKKV